MNVFRFLFFVFFVIFHSVISPQDGYAAPVPSPRNSQFGLSISDKTVRDIVARFGPILYMHPKEKYFPESVDDYVAKSYIQCYQNRHTRPKLTPTDAFKDQYDLSNLTLETVAAIGEQGEHCAIVLKNKKLGFRGQDLGQGGEIIAPAYVNVAERTPDYYVLQFCFFYSYNGPTVKLGKIKIGIHEGDWEHIDVHVVRKNKKFVLKRVHYAAHGPIRGHLYEQNKIPTQGNQPVGYAALYGHATLPKETNLDKNLDTTKKSNHIWNCGVHNEIIAINGTPLPGNEWLNFSGAFGVWGPTNPAHQDWWITGKSNTFNLIGDLHGHPYLPIENKKGKGTRPFTYESPSRLSQYLCLEFVRSDDGTPLNYFQKVPLFKLIQKKTIGNKVICNSEDAQEMTRNGENYRYCFPRFKAESKKKLKEVLYPLNLIKDMRFVWSTNKVPAENLGLKITGFEFAGLNKEELE